MKASLLTIAVIGVLLAFVFACWTAYDYALICTKCLISKHVVELRFFGVTLKTTTSDGEIGEDYQRIYGRPCVHVLHRGGFGRRTFGMIACGITAEGLRYQSRDRAVAMTFLAEKRFHDDALTRQTFSMIDRLAPPDKAPPIHEDDSAVSRQMTLMLLSSYLLRAKSVDDWRLILQAAESQFSDTTGLPDEPSP